jgi:hypothetical protein
MRFHRLLRGTAVLACAGASVIAMLAGASPALAADNCQLMYGSGDGLQNPSMAQFINSFNAAGSPGCAVSPVPITYTGTTGIHALDEFGNNITTAVDKTQDPVADADLGSPCNNSGPGSGLG